LLCALGRVISRRKTQRMSERSWNSILMLLWQTAMAFVMGTMLFLGLSVTASLISYNYEVAVLPPLHGFELDQFECQDESIDVIAKGIMDKTEYWFGAYATFSGMTVYDTEEVPNRLVWYRADPADFSPSSRPPGLQTMKIIIKNACRTPFVAYTVHISPVTGHPLTMKWGPFNLQQQG